MTKLVVGLAQPVLARRRKDVKVERIFERPRFVRHVCRDAENFAGTNHDFFSIDGEFQCALKNIRELLVVVVMQRDVAIFLDEDASKHDLLAMNHFAVDVRV